MKATIETVIAKVGAIRVNGVAFSREAIQSAVAEHNAAHPDLPLEVRGDEVVAKLQVEIHAGRVDQADVAKLLDQTIELRLTLPN